jgi:hypothetical protein
MQARHRIKPGWFQDPIAGKVWSAKLKFYDQHEAHPLERGVAGSGATSSPRTSPSREDARKVTIACNRDGELRPRRHLPELQGWLQAVMFKESAQHARASSTPQKFEECYIWIDKKMDEIRSARFVDDGEYEFGNISATSSRRSSTARTPAPWGWSFSTGRCSRTPRPGSLLPGDQTIILGATNAGKTRVMVTIMKHNIRRRRSSVSGWRTKAARTTSRCCSGAAMLNVTRPNSSR